jgi:hypothetical protein
VAALRWLFVVLLWAALDPSGPLLPVPVEALEESEDVAQRAPLRRRDRTPALRATARSHEIRDDAARSGRLVAAAPHRRERDAGKARKLPKAEPSSDSPADDH